MIIWRPKLKNWRKNTVEESDGKSRGGVRFVRYCVGDRGINK